MNDSNYPMSRTVSLYHGDNGNFKLIAEYIDEKFVHREFFDRKRLITHAKFTNSAMYYPINGEMLARWFWRAPYSTFALPLILREAYTLDNIVHNDKNCSITRRVCSEFTPTRLANFLNREFTYLTNTDPNNGSATDAAMDIEILNILTDMFENNELQPDHSITKARPGRIHNLQKRAIIICEKYDFT